MRAGYQKCGNSIYTRLLIGDPRIGYSNAILILESYRDDECRDMKHLCRKIVLIISALTMTISQITTIQRLCRRNVGTRYNLTLQFGNASNICAGFNASLRSDISGKRLLPPYVQIAERG